jgi:hypothetical protein
VRQITTGTVCHLDAEMLNASLADWDLAALDFLSVATKAAPGEVEKKRPARRQRSQGA